MRSNLTIDTTGSLYEAKTHWRLIMNKLSSLEVDTSVIESGATKVLDIGCGSGWLLARLQELEIPAIGVERNEIKPATSGLEIHQTDAQQMPFSNGSFGLAIAFMAFDTKVYSGDWTRIYSEINRVLTPGSHLVVTSTRQPSAQIAIDTGFTPLTPATNKNSSSKIEQFQATYWGIYKR